MPRFKMVDGVTIQFTAEEETARDTEEAAWAAGEDTVLTAMPAADQYLYLANGVADTADVFTAGVFLIKLIGHI